MIFKSITLAITSANVTSRPSAPVTVFFLPGKYVPAQIFTGVIAPQQFFTRDDQKPYLWPKFGLFLKFCWGQQLFAEEQAVKWNFDWGFWNFHQGSPLVYFSTGAVPAGFFLPGWKPAGHLAVTLRLSDSTRSVQSIFSMFPDEGPDNDLFNYFLLSFLDFAPFFGLKSVLAVSFFGKSFGLI